MRALIVIAVIVNLVIVVHTLFESNGWSHRRKLATEVADLRHDNDQLKDRVSTLRAQVDALTERTDVQEHVIRDELGYVREGDIVIDLGATPLP